MVFSGPAFPRHDQHLPAARLPPRGRSGSCHRGRGLFVVAVPEVHAPEVLSRPQEAPGRQDAREHGVVHVVVAVTRGSKFSSTLSVLLRTRGGSPGRTSSWAAAKPLEPAPIKMVDGLDIQVTEFPRAWVPSLSCPLLPLALEETCPSALIEGLDRWSHRPRRDVGQRFKNTALQLLFFATGTRRCQYLSRLRRGLAAPGSVTREAWDGVT